MFEAIHGSAPRNKGQNLANPSGLLLGAVMLLVHIGETTVAERVHNAWLRTIEDGIHTYDIYEPGKSKEKVGTKEFAEAVAQRVGQTQQTTKATNNKRANTIPPAAKVVEPAEDRVDERRVGVDAFLVRTKGSADD